MTDFCERASAREEQLLTDALDDQARRAGLRGKTINDSAINCRICDDPIPTERRSTYPGVQTCVDCQADLELELKKNGWQK